MAESDSKLANRILLGLFIGAAAGALTLAFGVPFPGLLEGARSFSTQVFDPIGQIFLRMLFFVVIPLVFASLTAGVVQLGELTRLGPLSARTFALFLANMSIACVLGLVMMNILRPGGAVDTDTKTRLIEEYGAASGKLIDKQSAQPDMSFQTVVDMFMPRNLLGAITGHDRAMLGEVLPLILFAILLGAAALQIQSQRREQLRSGLELVTELMTGIVRFALRLAPIAVPAMIYSVVVKIGWDILIALGVFVIACLVVMMLHLFGTMSLWLKFFSRYGPLEFWRTIRPVLVTAFSTSSSSATLPAALTSARDDLGIKPTTAGFVLPLGTTMNMAGTALYEGCVVLFVAQVFGISLGFGEQLTLLLLAVLGAVAVAGIPGGSLPIIAGLLITFGIPPEGIGVVLGADRLLDMARTVVNVGADMATTAVVDAFERKGSGE
ncbi:MAG: dicarboxylate/amino acid:cation symporter [Gammaproteobacteria bacterium]|nr:dicarboxylate/amino acid:cation symporter [Gammaproteobacteria bacterium]